MIKMTIYEGEDGELEMKHLRVIGDWWSTGRYKLTDKVEWLVIPANCIFDVTKCYADSKGTYNRFYIPVFSKIHNYIKNKGNKLWDFLHWG